MLLTPILKLTGTWNSHLNFFYGNVFIPIEAVSHFGESSIKCSGVDLAWKPAAGQAGPGCWHSRKQAQRPDSGLPCAVPQGTKPTHGRETKSLLGSQTCIFRAGKTP